LVLTIATLMLPFQVTLIPLFLVFKNLGWVGDFRPLILPTFFGNAYYIFLLRQFFMTIPPTFPTQPAWTARANIGSSGRLCCHSLTGPGHSCHF